MQAVVSDSGPIDLLYQYEHNQIRSAIDQFLGGAPTESRAADYQLASPINHISPRTPPLMLIYGGADSQVGVETADRFVMALHQAGLKDVSYHRLGHRGPLPTLVGPRSLARAGRQRVLFAHSPTSVTSVSLQQRRDHVASSALDITVHQIVFHLQFVVMRFHDVANRNNSVKLRRGESPGDGERDASSSAASPL